MVSECRLIQVKVHKIGCRFSSVLFYPSVTFQGHNLSKGENFVPRPPRHSLLSSRPCDYVVYIGWSPSFCLFSVGFSLRFLGNSLVKILCPFCSFQILFFYLYNSFVSLGLSNSPDPPHTSTSQLGTLQRIRRSCNRSCLIRKTFWVLPTSLSVSSRVETDTRRWLFDCYTGP